MKVPETPPIIPPNRGPATRPISWRTRFIKMREEARGDSSVKEYDQTCGDCES